MRNEPHDEHWQFYHSLANFLLDMHPDTTQQDVLQAVIYGAHTHYLEPGYEVWGKPLISVDRNLVEQYEEIVNAIRAHKTVWDAEGHGYTRDLLDPVQGPLVVQDLGEAIGEVEIERYQNSQKEKR